MPRVLITDDSPAIALLLRALFEREADFSVVGVACNGQEAVQQVLALKPDVVTMDIRMPQMDGFEATRQIMAHQPTPIVVISSGVDDEELRTTFRAIEAGALAVIEKPPGPQDPAFARIRRELVDTVRAMAEVKVIRRRHRPAPAAVTPLAAPLSRFTTDSTSPEVLAIGCSTGGPAALQLILSRLPAGFPLPILVVQHMSPGFVGGLLHWLQGSTALRLQLAQEAQPLLPGQVYFAPDGQHLQLQRGADGLLSRLSADPAVNGFRPSATVLLRAVAEVCGPRSIGLLLTGMGDDGAAGLLAMRHAGAHTLAQDEASSVVFGMPGSAIALGAVDEVLPLQRMVAALLLRVGYGTRSQENPHQ